MAIFVTLTNFSGALCCLHVRVIFELHSEYDVFIHS